MPLRNAASRQRDSAIKYALSGSTGATRIQAASQHDDYDDTLAADMSIKSNTGKQ